MRNSEIKSIKARQILDSRGEPTIEVDLETKAGVFRASVPSGTSKGKYEAKELRDGGKKFFGKGVSKAVKNVNKIIAPALKGRDVTKQKKIDELLLKLDGTKDKSRLGANAILGVSIAVCRAGAKAKNLPLYQYISQLYENGSRRAPQQEIPVPCFLLVEGGLHAGNNLDIQEFMIVPQKNSFSKNLEIGTEIYHTLGSILEKEYGKSATNVGLEGGFAPPLRSSEEALNLINKAIQKSDYKNVGVIVDIAASTFFYQKGVYKFEGGTFTKKGLLNYYSKLVKKYPIVGIEDPFAEDDWQGFKEMSQTRPRPIGRGRVWPDFLIIGDDLTVTNLKRVKKAVQEKGINALIIKPNQIGTVSETIEVVEYARENNLKIFVKHRSGETNDDFIADLAVGLNADGIMAGAPVRGERVAKYNRLLKIEEPSS